MLDTLKMYWQYEPSIFWDSCPSKQKYYRGAQSTPAPETVSDPRVTEPVDYPLTVQVLKATADLSGVEDGPLLVKARVAHVVDVKL